jgi:Tol biopolymer transport system component
LIWTTTVFTLHAQQRQHIKSSKIVVYNVQTKSTRLIYQTEGVTEAPNWSPDGKYLLINTNGNLYKLPLNGSTAGTPQKIDLGTLTKCNNDKSISPDGKLIAFSSSGRAKGSQVYTVPSEGGEPKLMVPETPSYFHGFSPDGKWLAVVAQRSGNFDLFRLAVNGGPQQQLTTNTGYDDGPDYSPDGKWIYFNSNRSGSWRIWRMPADGAGPGDKYAQQVTNSEYEDWFPHCSPNGKWLVFISFPKGTETHNGRMPGVMLRMIPIPGKKIRNAPIRTLETFFGGQGTINVNSWSPDSTQFAYVTYEP